MSTDPLFMKVGSEYYWYHNDHLGTPQMMTTSSGAVVWKAKYTSFGKATVDPGSTVVNPLRFSGQYEDAETGLHYNWFRYYNSEFGRYLRIDPLRLSQLKIAIQRINNDIRESSRSGKNGKSIRLLLVANLFYRYELYNPQSHDLYAFALNNSVSLIDPWGLLTTGQNIAIGLVGTTVSAVLSFSPLSPLGASLVGGAVSGLLTLAMGGDINEALWNGATAAFGGGLFNWGLSAGAEAAAAGLIGDYLLDFLWATTAPPWPHNFEENPCH